MVVWHTVQHGYFYKNSNELKKNNFSYMDVSGNKRRKTDISKIVLNSFFIEY